MGTKWVQPPHARLVKETASMVAHVREACQVPLPQPEFDSPAAEDLVAAVRTCVQQRLGLDTWREDRLGHIATLAWRLSAFSASIAALSPPHVHELVKDVNLAFLAAFVDAVEWPHTAIIRDLTLGFTIVGDIPDTGLFRLVHRPATAPASTLLPKSNRIWRKESVVPRLEREAKRGSAAQREAARAVEAATDKELAKGYVKGPYNAKQLHKLFGKNKWRPQVRFGVVQGDKVRPIDNAKAALLNAASRTLETIACITFEFPALVARIFFSVCCSLGLPMLALLLGLDDIRAAYRRIPVRQPQFTVFAIWSFRRGRVEYYWMPGHNFGLASSVLNFNAFPAVMVCMARSLLALPCGHYFDDYMLIDLLSAGGLGQACLATLHLLVGIDLEPTKSESMSPCNKALGVYVDVSRIHYTYKVFAFSSPERVQNILAMLRKARDADLLDPGTASMIRGKLGFVLTSSFSRVARAATQPLVQREWHDTDYSFSPALHAMLDFFEYILDRLPDLEIDLVRETRPPLIIYSDAMFTPASRRRERYSRAAWVVIDPVSGEVYHSDRVLPPSFFAALAPDDTTYILQAELVAAISVYYSLPRLLAQRPVIHFIDNTGALSLLVHGYSSRADCARLVNSFHVLHCSLRCKTWFDWVPSAANISDLPSRGEYAQYFAALPSSRWRDFALPPFETLMAPLASGALDADLRARLQ
jgi:hypothetical protein